MDNILLPRSEISRHVIRLGSVITRRYKNLNPVILCVLSGGFIFASDLVRNIGIDVTVDFIRLSSYRDGQTPSEIKLISEPQVVLNDRHVIVVDDILDTGHTLGYVETYLSSKGARSTAMVVLLSKCPYPNTYYSPTYVGEFIPKVFVYGYGLDYKGARRNLKDVWYVSNETI